MVFDSMTPNFNPKTYQEIFMQLITFAYKQGLLSDDSNFTDYVEGKMDIENLLIMDYSVLALVLSYIYQDMTVIYNANNINKATGYELDILLNTFLPRNRPSKAIGMVTFATDEVNSFNADIPIGTVVKTIGDRVVNFKTTEAGVLELNTLSVDIPVECLEYGSIGNVQAHEIDEIDTIISGVDRVDNAYTFSGGRDLESDTSYRRRGLSWYKTLIRGTPESVKKAIDDVPAVNSYYIDKFYRGYGSARIIIEPPLEIIKDALEIAIESYKLLDDDISVELAELITINVSQVINISIDAVNVVTDEEKARIEYLYKKYLTAFIDGGFNADGTVKHGLGIGQDFIPFEANVYIKTQVPDIKNIIPDNPDPITITPFQRATTGIITATVV